LPVEDKMMDNTDLPDGMDKLDLTETACNLTAHFEHFASLFDVLQSDVENESVISKKILAGLGLLDENERISLTAFRRILFENINIDTSFLYKRVFNAYDVERKGYLTPKQLISLLVTLLHGPFEAHVGLALRVYGRSSEASLDQPSTPASSSYTISKPDAVECIVESLQLSSPRARHTLTTTTREKARKVGEDLVGLIYPKLDTDKDGIISYNDFLKACEGDDSLIQVFGQFLPKTRNVYLSRPATPVSKIVTGKSETWPGPSMVKSTFEGIDYLKHSPTLGLMWGRQKDGPSSKDSKARLEPIPLRKPEVKQATPKPKAKKKPSTVRKSAPVTKQS